MTEMDVIYLAACAVNGEIPDRERVAQMNLQEVYAFAKRHMIASTVATSLERAGIQNISFHKALAAAQRKTILFNQAWSEMHKKLEEQRIWYMPLKGAMLKDMYPAFGMREFADHDILIDASRAEDVKRIMEGLGFSTKHFGAGNHDVYHKQPVLNFEMHTALFGPNHDQKLYEYYKDVEKRLIQREGWERSFSHDDFYLYMLAHEYKHYAGGGTGLRSLVDTFVYLRLTKIDQDYVSTETEKMGIRDFEEKNRSLAMRLFTGGDLTAENREMLDYITASGTYGTMVHRVQNRMQAKGWGKFRYMLDRFSVPISRKNREYEDYAAQYSLFYRYKILLPVLPFYRTVRAIRGRRFGREAKAIKDA